MVCHQQEGKGQDKGHKAKGRLRGEKVVRTVLCDPDSGKARGMALEMLWVIVLFAICLLYWVMRAKITMPELSLFTPLWRPWVY